MPVRRARATRAVGRGARRKLVWDTEQGTFGSLAVGGHAGIDMGASLATNASILGSTVVRTLVTIALPGYASGSDSYTYGVLKGRTGDAGSASTQAPDPFTNPELDWAWIGKAFATFSGATQDTQRVIQFDVRAKRKLQELNEIWLLMVTNNTAAIVTTAKFHTRTLFALA